MATSSMFKNWRTTIERIEKYVSPVYFADVNLHSRLYPKCQVIAEVFHGGSPTLSATEKLCDSQRPSFDDAMKLSFSNHISPGSSFGPTWATHWFKLNVVIPDEWLGREVHLRWNSESEAQLWSSDGRPLQGFSAGESHQERTSFTISKELNKTQQKVMYYVEMACNTLFGAGKESMISPPDLQKRFTIQKMEIAIFDRQVYELLVDLQLLHEIASTLGESNNRAYQALYTANHIINTVVLDSRDSYAKAHQLALDFFSQGNGESQLTVVPIGNCHIDTAWLWPYGETIRKCARSWSSTVRLFEEYPFMQFACSQAQQLYWVKKQYPTLFKDIQELSLKGKFNPVGGTWVEMDGNIPSGESFMRQFLYGQKFFKKEFNKICCEFWLPDTFGYSAQIPQMMKLCGAQFFLSQKLSWNLVNIFPHNTFLWEGIDGSSVIAHFPPANTYTANMNVKELLAGVKNFKDKGRVSESVLLYGFGDGGGGPHEDMLERAKRLKNVDGCPKLQMKTAEEFFLNIKQNEVKNLNTWVGELFLELHNGTYTTQATTKYHNRKREIDLHNIDFLAMLWAVFCDNKSNDDYGEITQEIETAWKNLLLNQFHDVLPGSSIKSVYDEATAIYENIISSLESVKTKTLASLFGSSNDYSTSLESEVILINTLPWGRTEVVDLKLSSLEPGPESPQFLVNVPAFGFVRIKDKTDAPVSKIEQLQNGHFSLTNNCITAVIDPLGRVTSLKVVNYDKEAIVSGCYANQFSLFDDVPLYWDAWDVMDYHLETEKPITKVKSYAKLSPNKREIIVELEISPESFIQLSIFLLFGKPYLSFKAKIHWRESHKFLKIKFPVNVHSTEAAYECQFGHLKRPTHFNTSWDWAKYEVCGHKWVDVSEYDWGVAILNDSKYGHAVHKNVMWLSLLRSPKSPDDEADMGWHEVHYAIMPHRGTFQEAGVIRHGYGFNYPLITYCPKGDESGLIPSSAQSKSFFSVDTEAIVIETVKLAEESKNGFVIRMYESFGGRCVAKLTCHLPVKKVMLCNGLEEIEEAPVVWENNVLTLSFSPFQIISLMMIW